MMTKLKIISLPPPYSPGQNTGYRTSQLEPILKILAQDLREDNQLSDQDRAIVTTVAIQVGLTGRIDPSLATIHAEKLKDPLGLAISLVDALAQLRDCSFNPLFYAQARLCHQVLLFAFIQYDDARRSVSPQTRSKLLNDLTRLVETTNHPGIQYELTLAIQIVKFLNLEDASWTDPLRELSLTTYLQGSSPDEPGETTQLLVSPIDLIRTGIRDTTPLWYPKAYLLFRLGLLLIKPSAQLGSAKSVLRQLMLRTSQADNSSIRIAGIENLCLVVLQAQDKPLRRLAFFGQGGKLAGLKDYAHTTTDKTRFKVAEAVMKVAKYSEDPDIQSHAQTLYIQLEEHLTRHTITEPEFGFDVCLHQLYQFESVDQLVASERTARLNTAAQLKQLLSQSAQHSSQLTTIEQLLRELVVRDRLRAQNDGDLSTKMTQARDLIQTEEASLIERKGQLETQIDRQDRQIREMGDTEREGALGIAAMKALLDLHRDLKAVLVSLANIRGRELELAELRTEIAESEFTSYQSPTSPVLPRSPAASQVVDYSRYQVAFQFVGNNIPVRRIIGLSSQTLIGVIVESGTFYLWDLEAKSCTPYQVANPTLHDLVDLQGDRQNFVTAAEETGLRYWNIDGTLTHQTHPSRRSRFPFLSKLAQQSKTGQKPPHITRLLRLSDTQVATGASDGTIKIWERTGANRLQERLTMRDSDRRIRDLVLLGPNRLAAASIDGIRLWEFDLTQQTYVQLNKFGQTRKVNNLCKTSGDGDDGLLVSGTQSGHLHVWDIKTGLLVHSFDAHSQVIMHLCELAPGIIATASWDTTLKIWDIKDGHKLLTHQPIEIGAHVTGLAATSDSRVIVGRTDGQIRIYDFGESGPADPVNLRNINAPVVIGPT